MREALLYATEKDSDEVICALCAHRCHLREGRSGICGVRELRDGRLYSLVYGRVAAFNADPVEKKPLFHFQPGTRTCSIATGGCNFRCRHCQNHRLSQYPRQRQDRVATTEYSADQVVEAALADGCSSLSYTYVEPTVFYEFARDCGLRARQQGLANIFVSNGYMTPETVYDLSTWLDAANIDLKAFTDRFYRQVCGASLEPVLASIRLLWSLGVWVEVTTLFIPGLNDTEEEMAAIAGFIRGVSPDIPWHVNAFFPTYRMGNRSPTPMSTLLRAREIGRACGLTFVYPGNINVPDVQDTRCPACDSLLIHRAGHSASLLGMADGSCSSCGHRPAGVW